MTERRGRGADRDATVGAVPGGYDIATGSVQLDQEAGPPAHWLLSVNGVPSSTVCPADPSWLGFEYLQVMAAVIALHPPPPPAALSVLHLGAAGCSLAWALETARPGSRQLAVDIDADLLALVRQWFALPRSPRLRLRAGEARQVLATRPDASADLVVRDVFAADRTPQHLRTVQFTDDVARVLRPGGRYLANLAAHPGDTGLADEIATVTSVFEEVAVIAETSVLRRRRYGNVVVVAGRTPVPVVELGRSVLRTGLALRVVHGDRLQQLRGRVVHDDPGSWLAAPEPATPRAGPRAGQWAR